MTENNNRIEVAEAAAYDLGVIIGSLTAGIIAGLSGDSVDRAAEERQAAPPVSEPCKRTAGREYSLYANDEEIERARENNDDCVFCWCNTCDSLDICENIGEVKQPPNGTTPNPCWKCGEGMIYRPREWIAGEICKCDGYIELME